VTITQRRHAAQKLEGRDANVETFLSEFDGVAINERQTSVILNTTPGEFRWAPAPDLAAWSSDRDGKRCPAVSDSGASDG